ncbi:MAG: dinuclear metal center YbgI/SA1388 family protein [Glaciecola sp.]
MVGYVSKVDTVKDWLDLVESHTPAAHAAGWDNVGLQVGDPGWLVERVLVSLDVTSEVIAEAAEVPGTLVLAHHPLLFRPLARLTPDTATGKIALAAAVSRVAVAAAHTNLDVADDGTGTSQPTATVLGLTNVRSLTAEGDDPRRGFGILGTLPAPTTLADLAARLMAGLPAPDLRFAGDPDRLATTVAIVGGAGDTHVGDAIDAGADVYVTGDLRHHVTLDALEMGLAVIDAGHHGTENPAMEPWRVKLGQLASAVGLRAPLVASAVPTSPWVRTGA